MINIKTRAFRVVLVSRKICCINVVSDSAK